MNRDRSGPAIAIRCGFAAGRSRWVRGQFVMIDPESKLVFVQAALPEGNYEELFALWAVLSSQLP